MRKLFKFVFLLPFWCLLCFSQSLQADETDSLKNLLTESHNIEQRIGILSRLSTEYLNLFPDSALYFANRGIQLSKNIDNDKYLGELLGIVGDVMVVKDSLDQAAKVYLQALDIFKKNGDFFNEAGILTVMGNIYIVKGENSQAMEYYLEALKVSEEYKIEQRLPYLYMNIGSTQYAIGNIEKAQEFYTKSLEGFKKVNDSVNIGRNYANLGLIYSDLDEHKIANDYILKSLEIFISIDAYADIATNYQSLALNSYNNHDYDQAIEFLQTSLEYIDKIDFNYAGPRMDKEARTRARLGEVYLRKGEIRKAYTYLSEAYFLGKKGGLPNIISNSANNLSLLFEKQGRLDSALFYYRIYKITSESLINEDNIKKLANLNAQYKYDQLMKDEDAKRKAEHEAQERENLYYIVAITVLLLLLILLVLLLLLWRSRLQRVELKQINLKNELELRNKELTTHVLYQLKKNEFILNISKKLGTALSKLKPENKKVIENVIRELDMDSGDDVWKEFEVRFQQVHHNFYKKLGQDFPDITSNELRLCGFLKLNMNTKDISAITYQSVNSIDVARSRLRQKFGLNKDANLIAFLSQY